MRKSTILWIMGILCVGMILVTTTQKVTDKRQELAKLQMDTQEEEEALRVLQAEWSYLNQPERLEKLNNQYLSLVPMTGKQFARLNDFENRMDDIPVATDTVQSPNTPKTENVLLPFSKNTTKGENPLMNNPVIATDTVTTDTVQTPPIAPIAGHILSPSLPPRKKPVAQKTMTVQPKTQTATTTPARPVTKTQPTRSINDVMRSLGVQ